MSLWTAYIIVAQGKGPMGRFIMLTYNLSALYAYSLSVRDMDDDEDEGGVVPDIVDIAFHRVVAVLSGYVLYPSARFFSKSLIQTRLAVFGVFLLPG